MTEALKLRVLHKPSIFNQDMGLGILAAAVISGTLPTMVLLAAAFGTVGGLIGKARQIKENAEGKIVSKPSIFTKDTAAGMASGYIIGGLFASLAAAAGFALLVGTGNPNALELTTGALPKLMQLGRLAGAMIGTYMGATHGQQRMATEYQAAIDQRTDDERRARATNTVQEQELMPSSGLGQSFADRLRAERTRQQHQQR